MDSSGKKRVVTSVPYNALIPVGIRTETRDDKYTTVAISTADFIDEVLLQVPPIPEPAYKVYTAILSQNGTGAPSANILENTIGNIVWSYSSAGNYLATLAGAFTSQKTFFYVSSQAGYNPVPQTYTQNIRTLTRITDGIVNLNQTNLNFTAGVFSSAGSVNDFSNLYLEIRVYN
jgi:hypothetical protein